MHGQIGGMDLTPRDLTPLDEQTLAEHVEKARRILTRWRGWHDPFDAACLWLRHERGYTQLCVVTDMITAVSATGYADRPEISATADTPTEALSVLVVWAHENVPPANA